MAWNTFVTIGGQVVVGVIVLCILAVIIKATIDSVRKSLTDNEKAATPKSDGPPADYDGSSRFGHIDEEETGIRD